MIFEKNDKHILKPFVIHMHLYKEFLFLNLPAIQTDSIDKRKNIKSISIIYAVSLYRAGITQRKCAVSMQYFHIQTIYNRVPS